MESGKKFTISMAPLWEEMLPIYLETLGDPDKADLHGGVRDDLRRMAKLADMLHASQAPEGADQCPACGGHGWTL